MRDLLNHSGSLLNLIRIESVRRRRTAANVAKLSSRHALCGDRRLASAPIESTRRYYLARAQRCGNSSRSRRWGSHHGASNDDANDDSNALE